LLRLSFASLVKLPVSLNVQNSAPKPMVPKRFLMGQLQIFTRALVLPRGNCEVDVG